MPSMHPKDAKDAKHASEGSSTLTKFLKQKFTCKACFSYILRLLVTRSVTLQLCKAKKAKLPSVAKHASEGSFIYYITRFFPT